MNGFIAFAEVTGVILASLGVALALEWYGLNGLMRLLPSARNSSTPDERP
ncbi:MAG: hypothetical protein ACRD3S_20560 [Terracidiphilus sp.]